VPATDGDLKSGDPGSGLPIATSDSHARLVTHRIGGVGRGPRDDILVGLCAIRESFGASSP